MEKYVVIDLEMCRVGAAAKKRGYRFSHEIIQIGAVLLDENYQYEDQFATFVRPDYGQIDSFIRKLTGISQKQVEDAPDFKKAMDKFLEWIGDREVRIMSWSDTDRAQIRKEMEQKKYPNAGLVYLLETWIDYQKVFMERFEFTKSIALKDALMMTDLDQEGREHDGLTDAINTAHMITKLENDPDYTLPRELILAREEKVEELSFSMGDLFKGIHLDS